MNPVMGMWVSLRANSVPPSNTLNNEHLVQSTLAITLSYPILQTKSVWLEGDKRINWHEYHKDSPHVHWIDTRPRSRKGEAPNSNTLFFFVFLLSKVGNYVLRHEWYIHHSRDYTQLIIGRDKMSTINIVHCRGGGARLRRVNWDLWLWTFL